MYKLTIEENIKRILSTNKYTKILQPTFGLDRHIDKRVDLKVLSYLKDDIYEQLHTYEPRIKLKEIRLIPTQNNRINIEITYITKDTNDKKDINIQI